MSLRLGALQDALLEAGASEGTAKKAAEELAEYQTTMHTLELAVTRMDGRIEKLMWMVGTNAVLTAGVLVRLLLVQP